MTTNSKIFNDVMYFSTFYRKFTVDVLQDGAFMRGFVVDMTANGLLIDLHHVGNSIASIPFAQLHTIPDHFSTCRRYGDFLQETLESKDIEVLIRCDSEQPLTWTKADNILAVPSYGNRPRCYEGEQCVVAKIATGGVEC
ncbi:uncharacterized protein LOC129598449 [Paramacrobiotus metropolitanus]|uniref:uncharacterized protein LOC129598449 n=1 Tax=Paramacrobiotus metropolitanus TaxID=2943436 RepID=UPI002445E561|nr:uncharacterized protein LOC129598449 [Paramacrobiotus metropolitanus]